MSTPALPEGLPLQETLGKNDFENEAVFRRNCLPHRCYYIPETSECLNGSWDFHYALTPNEAPDAGQISAHKEPFSGWSKTAITVPGHWQLQGDPVYEWGRPCYTNVQYPIPVTPPLVPVENPTGTYHRTYTVPSAWDRSSQLRLRFDGVDSAYHVWVNGVLLGYAQGSRNAAEFDVSKVTRRDGVNHLVVQVYQWSDGTYIEDQDQWWLSGIFRDVHLIAFPTDCVIQDWFIKTDLDATYKDAELLATVSLAVAGSGEHFQPAKLTLRLTEIDGTDTIATVTEEIKAPGAHTVNVRLAVSNPRKWTAETPHRYRAELRLRCDDKAYTVHQNVGFRKVELLRGLICVNGTPIRFRGVNRHDHHPKLGRAVPLAFMLEDIKNMKKFNINALRCSHYPPHPKLLDMADEYGLWIIDEADLECHGFYDAVARPLGIPEEVDYEERKKVTFPLAAKYTSDNDKWCAAYLDRMHALVQRDKNHPSVVIWSLGNEAFYGRNHKAMYEYAKAQDPTRLVHYEGDALAESADMYSYMYPPVERLARLAETEGVNESDGTFEKPIVLCEYAHAMGNGPGGLEDYEQLFRQYPRLQGGFIWEWANHGLWKSDETKAYFAYGGDFADFPNDGTFVMDGLCRSTHDNTTPLPGLLELKKVFQPVRMALDGSSLSLQNLYNFIDLSHLKLHYEVAAFDDRNGAVLGSGFLDIPHVAPGKSANVSLPLDKIEYSSRGEVLLTVVLSQQEGPDDVATFQEYLVPTRKDSIAVSNADKSLPKQSQQVKVKDSKTVLQVDGDNWSIQFDKSRGYLQSWKVDGLDMLIAAGGGEHGPALAPGFWRPPTDNDVPASLPYWKRFGVDVLTRHRMTQFSVTESGSADKAVVVQINTTIAPPVLAWAWECAATYTVTGVGALHVFAHLKPTGAFPEHVPRIGLDLCLPQGYVQATWYGRGPGESYPDKGQSQLLGIHQADCFEQAKLSYEVPQENGNHMETGWLRLSNKAGGSGCGLRASVSRLTVDKGDVSAEAARSFQDLRQGFHWAASPYTAENVEAAKHPCDLEPQPATFVRLDAVVAGVGSAACGPGVRPDLLAKVEETSFAFCLEPLVE